MSRLRPSLNVADAEGRPVLRPASGNNTATGDVPSIKPSQKSVTKTPPSVKSPKTRPDLAAKSPSPNAAKPAQAKSLSKNESFGNSHNKSVGKSPKKMNGSYDSPPFRPPFLRGSSFSSSLTASCSSSEASTDSSSSLAAAKKAAALENYAQKRLRVSCYGRKNGSSVQSKVVPDDAPVSPTVQDSKKRCGWITPQSDEVYSAFHDEEWGVPVHDDKKLFEFLVLSSALQELSWPAILAKRDVYREIFCDFDPVAIASFDEKKIKSLKSNSNEAKLRGIVDNARYFLKIVEECGSFDNYCWSFVNHKPICNKYRYPRQVPVKIAKAEVISKDLVKRGFRYVGPTIMYSFMQATGMTNDHLVSCFRHEQCNLLVEGHQAVNSMQECRGGHQAVNSMQECRGGHQAGNSMQECRGGHQAVNSMQECRDSDVEKDTESLVTAMEGTVLLQDSET